MKQIKYPSLYQVNTRVWLTDLSQILGRKATLDDIPDSALDRFQELGFDLIWFLSVWSIGELGRKISLTNPEWQSDFKATLPDLKDEDIAGSGFAISNYTVSAELGGNEALIRLRKRLADRGLKLMLDFVPNHMGPDHLWVEEHPDYFIAGTETDLEIFPQNYTRVKRKHGEMIFAYGRDPYFSGWSDTLQLDYSNPATAEAMTCELLRISDLCDGVRCDMAMLILPEVFEKTWGRKTQSFWPNAIKTVREKNPDFCFLAEVYWDMEWQLQQLGFDFTYDKRLYDRLNEGNAKAVREHFFADIEYQNKLARFLENHDETRAAATFGQPKHEAAAIITFLSPGLKFFHQGQFEGRKKRISAHLIRAPKEPVDSDLQKFYESLLSILRKPVFRNGNWKLLECVPAWDGNATLDSFLAFACNGLNGEMFFIVVNYSPDSGQCYLQFPFSELTDKKWILKDLMNETNYEKDGNDLLLKGLYLDMPAWHYHVFKMENLKS